MQIAYSKSSKWALKSIGKEALESLGFNFGKTSTQNTIYKKRIDFGYRRFNILKTRSVSLFGTLELLQLETREYQPFKIQCQEYIKKEKTDF